PLKGLYRKVGDALDSAGPRVSAYETLPVPGSIDITKKTKRVMGVRIPILTVEKCEKNPHPLNKTIDIVSAEVADLIPSIIAYAQTSCTLRRIARELSKTRKREKAIEEIHLPRYITDIIRITESLDENEREELSRYKSLKRRLSAGNY
ncbi:MAG TPA: V-type ATP synthase subunit D, partial [Spirochaetota bacterium]|nr:V-type ATP synthase subunit D [Spirochaetota bacterium]